MGRHKVSLYVAAVVALDAGARLAVPTTIVGLAHSAPLFSSVAAGAVALMAASRGLVAGRLQAELAEQTWGRLADALQAQDVLTLRARSPTLSSSSLLQAAHAIVNAKAATLPRIAADAIGLMVVAVFVSWRLHWGWLALGAVVTGVFAVLAIASRRAFRREDGLAFEALTLLAQELDVMLRGAIEVRAQGCDARLRQRFDGTVRSMAAAERRANAYSALMGLVPVGLGLGAASVPLWLGTLSLGAVRIAEVAAVGGAGLVFLASLARGVEQLARSTEARRLFRDFVDSAPAFPVAHQASSSSWSGDVRLVDVSVVYPGESRATPAPASFVWPTSGGVALVGENGAGKSTLAHVLLGLIAPTTGQVAVDGRPLSPTALAAMAPRVALLTQAPFVSEPQSVRWHLATFSPRQVSDDAMRCALRETGVWSTLAAHALRESDPLDVPMSELSGGERRRVQLAGVLGRVRAGAELVVLDEPEVALDRAGRVWLRGLLEMLAAKTKVLVIAHDLEVVPETFLHVECASRDLGR